ncbi:hypothetical protein Pyn_22069 [Prunus yedoensis var. nudiflora]|uniref:Uncharacterized protein n=1 Tax=Prunus yedoensis var. nudiflora TaxID=2094558 RepID=A0A314Z639_PRUYE|nr:hypothetical protein Pyn_22069 [Prunus yedoensis var. nudiflora]
MATDRGFSEAGAKPYLLKLTAWQFGLIRMSPFPLLSTNRLSFWKADVSQGHDVAETPFQP